MSQITSSLKQAYNNIPTSSNLYYSIPFDLATTSYQGVPVVSYLMIIMTTGVLAYVTYAEKSGSKSQYRSSTPSPSKNSNTDKEDVEENIEEAEPIEEDEEEEEEKPLSKTGGKKHSKKHTKKNKSISKNKKTRMKRTRH